MSPIQGSGGGDALTTNPLSQFAATTSSQLKGVISDENAPDGASSKLIMALGSLSVASGKTITASKTLTLDGTDGTTMTFPTTSATIARTDAANTFTGVQTMTSPAFTTPVLGTPTSGTLTNCTIPFVGVSDHYFIRAASTVTQANDANPHAIFTTPANGTLALPTGVYRLEGVLSWTSMTATSGNMKVDFLGAGNATTTGWSWAVAGCEASGAPGNSQVATYFTAASAASIVTASTQTSLSVMFQGMFDCTVLGTMIPTQTIVTAAAAVLAVGSYIRFTRVAATGSTSVGPWS